MDTMTFLFDQEYNEKMYGISKYKEGREEGREEGRMEGRMEGREESILELFTSGDIPKAVAMKKLAMTEEELDEAIAKLENKSILGSEEIEQFAIAEV